MNQLPSANNDPNFNSPRSRTLQSNASRLAALAAAVALAAVLGGCSSGTPSAAPTLAATHSAAAAPAPTGCKLKTTFNYIVRDDDPGASVMASEIGNADLANCTSSLTDFAATAGQASGECTTIALASSNPGYNVNAVPAAPLKDVIMSAGPGC